MRWVLCLAVWCGGCGSSLEYQGWSPSVRAFREEPELKDTYVGIDAEFVVADRRASWRPAATEGRPLDVWNTPVAYQPLTAPDVNPVREAGVSAEPVLEGK